MDIKKTTRWSWENEECLKAFREAVLHRDGATARAKYLDERFLPSMSDAVEITRNVVISGGYRENVRQRLKDLFPADYNLILTRLAGSKTTAVKQNRPKKPNPIGLPAQAKGEPPRPPRISPEALAISIAGDTIPALRGEDGKTATLETLNSSMCSWPIGDPLDPDFAYCARGKVPRGSYCPEHQRLAYRPSSGAAKKKRAGRFQDAKAISDAVRTTKM